MSEQGRGSRLKGNLKGSQAAESTAPRLEEQLILVAILAMGISYLQWAETGNVVSQVTRDCSAELSFTGGGMSRARLCAPKFWSPRRMA